MKLLYGDIETAPNSGYFFSPLVRFLPKSNVIDTSRTLCYSYMWKGDRSPSFEAEWSNEQFLYTAWELLNECDAIVTYNGEKFDLKVLNWEFAQLGLPPPRPYASIDLYRVVKANFKLPYYSMDYVCEHLGIGRKLKHQGIGLWVKTMHGDEKARREMRKYNIQDVKLMPALYKRLLPWIKKHPNMGLYTDKRKPTCTKCGSTNIQPDKYYKSPTQIYPQYRCDDCGSWARGRATVITPEQRADILTGV